MITACLLALLSVAAIAETITVNSSPNGTRTVTWTNNNTYILNGFVFVNEGQTLTIEPGTVIKGKPGQGAEASALIVARGAKIMAAGTENQPIIFTAEADNMDINLDARGLWGGVLILGKATTNSSSGTGQIEGIPSTEPRGAFGGNDDNDNSGVFKYASIRYGGTNIGANNEINGLTMGAVGRGTEINHVEVVYNADDGFEWFGGTVNTSHLVSAFNDDDCFDYDEGFRGKGQYWFSLQAPGIGDKAGEHDGGTDPEDALPYSIPHIYNYTYIGSGTVGTSSNAGLHIRDYAGCHYYNGVVCEFKNFGVDIEDLATGNDSRMMFENGSLTIQNSMFFNINDNSVPKVIKASFAQSLINEVANKNTIADPQLVISRAQDGLLDPRAHAPAALTDFASVPANDPFFTTANYLGAFNPSGALWTDRWTFLHKFNFIKNTTTSIDEELTAANCLLEQNYPNPFNPTTDINFTLQNSANVNLTVYDAAGRTISSLVKGHLNSGRHSISFDGAGLNSGVYFYQLSVDGKSVTKKMLLSK